MASQKVKAPHFVDKAIQTSVVELEEPVFAEPAIEVFATLRDIGSSSLKHAYEFAKWVIPHSSFRKGSKGEVTSYKKAKL